MAKTLIPRWMIEKRVRELMLERRVRCDKGGCGFHSGHEYCSVDAAWEAYYEEAKDALEKYRLANPYKYDQGHEKVPQWDGETMESVSRVDGKTHHYTAIVCHECADCIEWMPTDWLKAERKKGRRKFPCQLCYEAACDDAADRRRG